MSREIKFRIWNGDRFTYGINTYVLSLCGDVLNGKTGESRKDWIIQQLTGLKDKNERNIYEGDIISAWDGEYTVLIEYCKEYAKYGGVVYLEDGHEPGGDSWIWFDDMLAENGQIIGNIFETPELLEESVKR